MKLFDQKKDVKNITLQMLKQRTLTQIYSGIHNPSRGNIVLYHTKSYYISPVFPFP